MTSLRRKLSRVEINLLKHLALCGGIGFPVVVPRALRHAVLSLWRMELIDVWYRQLSDTSRSAQFVSITVDGHSRIHTLAAIRSSSPTRFSIKKQGRGEAND